MAARQAYQAPSGGGDGQRACARGEWCSSATVVPGDGTRQRWPALGYQAFCPADTLLIGRDLSQLPAQYLWLSSEAGNPRAGVSRIRVPFGPKIPIRLDIAALSRAMADVLTCWHERVAAAASLTFPAESRSRRDAVAVRDAAKTLGASLSVLLGLPAEPVRRAITLHDLAAWPDDTSGIVHSVFAEINVDMSGADAGNEILHLRWLCRAVLGETRQRPEELLGVPCRDPDCDKLSLRRAELPPDPEVAGFWSQCAACGDLMTEDEYRDWTRRYARWAGGQWRDPEVLENLPGAA